MTAPVPVRRLLRDPRNRVVGGVAAGLAEHLGVSVTALRVGFFALALVNGLGAILYAAFWAVLPVSEHPRRRNVLQLLAFAALGAGVLLLSVLTSATVDTGAIVGWLAAVVALGAGIIWHQADPGRRQRWSRTVPRVPWLGAVLDFDRRAYLTRFVGGGLLVAVGIIGIIAYVVQPLSGAGLGAIVNG